MTRYKLRLKKNWYVAIMILMIALTSCGSEDSPPYPSDEGNSPQELMELRPNFHLTPPVGWMNDPNGMVYYKGEYHIFYQHNPNDIVWGPMHWRHAVSTDLLSWKDLGVKLAPDNIGTIFSGSAVVDWNNTSGFKTGDEPPLVAIFTHAGNSQVQSLAYSNDRGDTWTKYANNPVLEYFGDFRDPKVFFYEPRQKWIMSVAAGNRIKIYSSDNLIDWDFESDLGPNVGYGNGVWECPDLFPLVAEDGVTKWIMLVSVGGDTNYSTVNGGGATQYFVGEFDGTTFIPDNSEVRWIDYGIDNYAGITWSDIPKEDGRKIFIGWMNNWPYAGLIPANQWRGAMTLPREITLKKDSQGKYFPAFLPIRELDNIVLKKEDYGSTDEFKVEDNAILAEGSFRVKSKIAVQDNSIFEVKLYNSNEEIKLLYNKSSGRFTIDRNTSARINFHDLFPRQIICDYVSTDQITLDIIMDKSSIEVFINNGDRVMTALCFPRYQLTNLSITSTKGSIQVEEVQLLSLKKTINEN